MGVFAALSGEVEEEAAFWNLSWGSVFETNRGGQKTQAVALSSKGLGGRDVGGRTQTPRERQEPAPGPHPPSALAAGPSVCGAASGSRPPRRDLPPVCVCCKTAAVGGTAFRPQKPGPVGARAGAEGLPCCRGAGQGATPHPLPGLLQVVPQDFADLFLLVLGQCRQDALCRQGLGVDVPGRQGTG